MDNRERQSKKGKIEHIRAQEGGGSQLKGNKVGNRGRRGEANNS